MRTLLLAILLIALASSAVSASLLSRFAPEDFTAIIDTTTDSRGNVFLCGVTKRPEALPGELIRLGKPGRDDFDAFVIKLRPDGAVAATLLIGGGGYEIAERIVTDSLGNVIISGTTSSIDFPVAHALHPNPGTSYEPFVCKLDASLQRIVFSTFLNGTYLRGLAVDHSDNVLVAGITGFTTQDGLFPRQNSFSSDVFVAKLGRKGELAYATRLHAGSGGVSALAVDTDGVACIVGQTSSGDFPLLNAVQPFKPAGEGLINTFLARVDANGMLISSTFLGSSCGDQSAAVAVNPAGEIFVAGVTSSDSIPVTAPASSPTCNSLNRGFIIKLGPGATNVIYSTILSYGWHHNLSSITVGPRGGAIVGGTISTLSWETGVPFLATIAPDGSASTYFPETECGIYASINHLALKPSGQIVFSGNETSRRLTAWNATYVKEINASVLRTRQPPAVRLLPPHPFHFAPAESIGLTALVSGFDHFDSVIFYERGKAIGIASNGPPFSISLPALSPGRHSFTAVARSGVRRVISCPVSIMIGSPRNDNFANRIQLAGQRLRVRGTTLGATDETDEAVLYGRDSVWYSWRAPRDGAFEFKMLDESFRALGTVFTGDSLLNLDAKGSFYPWGGSFTVFCGGGETYQIRVAGYGSGESNFRFTVRPVARPSNDDFTSAEALSGSPVTVRGSLAHSTVDEGDERFGQTVWYSWTAPASGLYRASTENGLAFVQIATGTSVSNLAARGQSIYGLITGSAFYAQAGETYFLSVSPWNSSGDFTLTIEPHEPPPNDNFAQRIRIPSDSLSVTGSCIGATSEPGESPFVSPEANSVWWKWVAPSSGVYRIDLFVPYPPPHISAGGTPVFGRPGIGERVSVYSGNVLGVLTSESDPFSYNSTAWRAKAGVEYQIKIDSGAALLTLDITPVPPPANDNFADALPINPTFVVRGTTEGAGLEIGEPVHRGTFNPARSSVWYRWVAPSDDVFVLDTQANVEVFTGETLTELVRITNSTGRLFRATTGTVYSIAVFDSASFTLHVRVASRPGNDDFAQSYLLSGLNVDFTADLHDATIEPGEPDYSYWEKPTATVWYSWVAPTNGNFILRPTNWLGMTLTVYTGDTLTNLTLISHGYFQVDFNAAAGTTYRFSLEGGMNNWRELFGVQLRFHAPPSNDNFADRILLSGTNVVISGSNVAATVETNEPAHGVSVAGKSVWYSWTAPRTGRASFDLSSTFSAVLSLYTGSELTNLVALLPLEYSRTKFNVAVQEGTTYQLAVDGYAFFSIASGTFTLNIHYATPPVNDDFANRLPVQTIVRAGFISIEANGTLEGASRESGEPDYAGDPLGSSAWWTWTAPSSGIYKVFLQASESLEVAMFTGNSLPTLQNVGPPYSASYFYFEAQAGVAYAIQISGRAGRYADYKFTLQSFPPPPNDDFENRISFTNAVNGTLEGATRQFGEPTSNGNTNSGSVWFTWIAPEDGTFELRETLMSYIVSLRVYRGDTLSNLVSVSSSTDYDWSRTWFTATSGISYVIQVSDYGAWSGAFFALSIQKSSGSLPPPPIRPPPAVPVPAPAQRQVPSLTSTVIETSTNLIDWQLWRSNTTETNWSIPTGTEPQRFFRVR